MSTTTTRATIADTATRNGWHTDADTTATNETPDRIIVSRGAARVVVSFDGRGAIVTATIRTGDDVTIIGRRDAGKSATVVGWLTAAPVGYPRPGIDAPATDEATDADEAPVRVRPINFPNSMWGTMSRGHRRRLGHELTGVLVSLDGGEIWHVLRSCCRADDVSFMPDAVHATDGISSVRVTPGTETRDAYDAAPHGYRPADTARPDAVDTAQVASALSYTYSSTDPDGNECAYFARRHDAGNVHALDVYRVSAVRDEDNESPRDWDNLFEWTLTGAREFVDIDEGGAIASVFADMSEKYSPAIAYEITRMYARRTGGVVFGLSRGHDGTVSLFDDNFDIHTVRTVRAGSKIVRHPAPYAPSSWHGHRFIEKINGAVDGIAYVSGERIKDEMQAGMTGAAIRRNLDGEISAYNDYVNGNIYGAVVERATVNVRDDDDTDVYSLDYAQVDDGACWGFYGDDYAASGLVEHAVTAINGDAVERDAEILVTAARGALHEQAIDTLVTLALQIVSGAQHAPLTIDTVHYRSLLARALETVQSSEFLEAHPYLDGRTDIEGASLDAPVWLDSMHEGA